MSLKNNHGLLWTNILLVLATVSFYFACRNGFGLSWMFDLISHLFVTVFLAVVSFIASFCIRKVAGLIFDCENRPWYVQRGGMVFLVIALALVFVPTGVFTNDDGFRYAAACWHPLFFITLSFTILSTVVLAWLKEPGNKKPKDTHYEHQINFPSTRIKARRIPDNPTNHTQPNQSDTKSNKHGSSITKQDRRYY